VNCDSNGIVWRGLGLDLLVRELHHNHNEALFVLSIVPITPTGVLVWGLDNVALNVEDGSSRCARWGACFRP
jgi:hypothetical protein